MSLVAIMADDERRSTSYQSSPPSAWGDTPHVYPHSHHGTPAQEHSGFNFGFNTTHMPMEGASFRSGLPHQRAMPAQLQPLIMPQWPSMLSSQSHAATYHQPVYQPVQPLQPLTIGPLQTPVSATSSRSASTPRKTLTDADRKRMCEYAEKNPSAKQMEIGGIFGVERSTVSKVLRQKEKFLSQDEGRRSPVKRNKGRSPDIERALANWAKTQEKKGVRLTDDLIREQARVFATTSPSPDSYSTLTAAWMEKFKLRNNLMGARSRKGSLAPDDADIMSTLSSSQTPSGTSPVTTPLEESSSPKDLRSAESRESLKNESPDGYVDFNGRLGPFHSQSSTSLNSAFTDHAPSFSPNALSPRSPFFTPDSGTAPGPFVPPLTARPILPASMSNNSQRPRSQTFPLLDAYMTAGSADLATPRYIPHAMLDSPMEEAGEPLLDISGTGRMGEPDEKPHTVSPSETMRPPPLPAHILGIKREMTPITPSSSAIQAQLPITTMEDARCALDAIMMFLGQQPDGFLSFQESVNMSKVMEKLTLHSRAGN